MADTEPKGLVQTVLGTVPPEVLGPTMTHEHLLIDFTPMLQPLPEATVQQMAGAPVTLENLSWVRHNHYSNQDNLLLGDEDTAITEALLYKRLGGSTIVDATTIGIGRDPLGLARIARATGLNIIAGAGYYVDTTHPDGMDAMTEADIATQIAQEIQTGIGDTGVRAGVIGEIGCSWPLTSNERKVLRAAARAQQQTGAAVLIHPGRNDSAPREILDVLAEAGGDVGRAIMGHLDRTIFDADTLLELARSGCYLEYDLFGNEASYYPLADSLDMPSDAQRMDYGSRLVAEGYGDKVVISHDIATKHRLVRYGGHGYGHILEHIVPRLRKRGLGAEDVEAILVTNPARVLAFA